MFEYYQRGEKTPNVAGYKTKQKVNKLKAKKNEKGQEGLWKVKE
jgi:hypothetical protein